MCRTSALKLLPILSDHVEKQFSRRGNLAEAQFLYSEVAERMLRKLRCIQVKPQNILDAGCGSGDSLVLLRKCFPNSHYLGVDICAPFLKYARKRYKTNKLSVYLKKLMRWKTNSQHFFQADLASTGLPDQSSGLVWSNLSLHWHPCPHAVLNEWNRVLKENGVLMFSCFGPTTLRELRSALCRANLCNKTLAFTDMHDLGDLLVESNFCNPVMDQDTLTLLYSHPERLLKDVQALGGNPVSGRSPGLSGRTWRNKLCLALTEQKQADGKIRLTIEVVYGHAWRRPGYRNSNDRKSISLSLIK